MSNNMIFIHPTAIVESDSIGNGTKIWAYSHICKDVKIGKNCTIGEGVYIGPNVTVGNNCKIQNHSLIYEGVIIEDEVFIGPNVITTNDKFPRSIGEWRGRFLSTLIKRGASICANSTIICGHTIGEHAMVGAGSVVSQDIKSRYIAYGNPARHIRELKGYAHE
jgi:UDP-2-acetamido-3-amino-2,3-dideoxy-glucuronate N-acetyltransferase